MIKDFFKNNPKVSKIFIISLIVILALFLRFEKLSKRELWVDELDQIGTMNNQLSFVINHNIQYLQFPGDYILIYPFYKLFGENKWGLAIPHIIVTIFGFYLLYILCDKYLKTIWAYIITFIIVTFNVNLIFHAFEIRPYAVLATLGIAAFLVIQYIFENENLSILKKVLISAFIFATILFHFYGLFILFFSYIFHFLTFRKNKPLKLLLRHLKYYGIAVIIALPIFYKFISIDKSYLKTDFYNTFQFIDKGLVPILKGVFGNLIGFKKFYFFLIGIIISSLIPHKDRFKQIMFFILLVVVPISFILLSCVIINYWFIQRLFVWVMPLFAFLIGWSWDSMIVFVMEKLKKYAYVKVKT